MFGFWAKYVQNKQARTPFAMSKEKKTLFVHQPQYKGGPKELTKFIYSQLRYPNGAFQAGVEGTVFIEYDIDYKGNVVATRVLKGIGHGCDEEATRVVKMLKFDVERNRGIHVLFHQKVKVLFKKPKSVAQPTPQPSTPMQVAYTIIPASAAKPAEPVKAESVTYQYTVTIS